MRQRPLEQDRFERRNNFEAVEENLTAEQVKLEAGRCLNCKNPQCVKGCPVNIQIPDFIKALKEDDLERAELIHNKAIEEEKSHRARSYKELLESTVALNRALNHLEEKKD